MRKITFISASETFEELKKIPFGSLKHSGTGVLTMGDYFKAPDFDDNAWWQLQVDPEGSFIVRSLHRQHEVSFLSNFSRDGVCIINCDTLYLIPIKAEWVINEETFWTDFAGDIESRYWKGRDGVWSINAESSRPCWATPLESGKTVWVRSDRKIYDRAPLLDEYDVQGVEVETPKEAGLDQDGLLIAKLTNIIGNERELLRRVILSLPSELKQRWTDESIAHGVLRKDPRHDMLLLGNIPTPPVTSGRVIPEDVLRAFTNALTMASANSPQKAIQKALALIKPYYNWELDRKPLGI